MQVQVNPNRSMVEDSQDGKSSEITNVYLTKKNNDEWLNLKQPDVNSSNNLLEGSLGGKVNSAS